jgi:hypothetical protein
LAIFSGDLLFTIINANIPGVVIGKSFECTHEEAMFGYIAILKARENPIMKDQIIWVVLANSP